MQPEALRQQSLLRPPPGAPGPASPGLAGLAAQRRARSRGPLPKLIPNRLTGARAAAHVRTSDSDLLALHLVLLASGSGPITGPDPTTVSRNEIGTRRMALPKREVTDALPEKAHYKTRLDDRGGASIIVNGDQCKIAARVMRTGLNRAPIHDGEPPRTFFGGQSRRTGR